MGSTVGIWPHSAVRDVIEEVASTELEGGIEVGLYNSRGVFWRNSNESGVQERQLAEQYAGFAAAINDRWPRTAAMLRRIANGYRADAHREDQEAELREDLDR
jgi:alpha-L-fucosidase